MSKKWTPDSRKFLTFQEMERLRQAVKQKAETSKVYETAYCFIRIGLETGMRVSEMCNIKVKDIYFDGTSFIRTLGKGSKYRNVILPNSLKTFLQQYIVNRQLQPEDHLLISSHGKPFTRFGLSYMYKQCCKLAGIQSLGVHSMRHSFASFVLQSTGDLKLVQQACGHSNISITSVYLHQTHEEVSSKLNQVFG